MPLTGSANYSQYGTTEITSLSIDNASTYGSAEFLLTLALQPVVQPRGRFSTRTVTMNNQFGGKVGIWYPDQNWMQIIGTAPEINEVLQTLRYHADRDGYFQPVSVQITVGYLSGGTGNIFGPTNSFTLNPVALYSNPPLFWAGAISLSEKYKPYSLTTAPHAAIRLPGVTANDATNLRLTMRAMNPIGEHFEIFRSSDSTESFNLIIGGQTLGPYNTLSALAAIVNANSEVSGSAFFRFRCVASPDNQSARLEYMGPARQNQIGIPGTLGVSLTVGGVIRSGEPLMITASRTTYDGAEAFLLRRTSGTSGPFTLTVTDPAGSNPVSLSGNWPALTTNSLWFGVLSAPDTLIVGRRTGADTGTLLAVPQRATATVTTRNLIGNRTRFHTTPDNPIGRLNSLEADTGAATWANGRVSYYHLRPAVNAALQRIRYFRNSTYTGDGKFNIQVGDGKGNTLSHDLFVYSSLGRLHNANHSVTVPEFAQNFTTFTTPLVIVAPSFDDGYVAYTARLAPTNRFHATVRTRQPRYGTATPVWTPPITSTGSNNVTSAVISNGTKGRRGGFRWVVGDTAQIQGGSGSQATIRIDQITGPFQIPYTVMTAYITSAGTGYAVNDIVTLDGGAFGAPHRMRVTSVGAGGSVTALIEEGAGGGQYTTLPSGLCTTTRVSGSGSGLTITLPAGMPAAGAASAISILDQGSYTSTPPTSNNEVVNLGASNGFWLEVNLTLGSIDLGGYLTISGQRDDVNSALSDLSISLGSTAPIAIAIGATITSTLGLNAVGSITVNQNANLRATNFTAGHVWTEDQTYTFSPGLRCEDLDTVRTLTTVLTLSAAAGSLAATGVTPAGTWNSGLRTWSLSAPVAQMNAALNALQFFPAPDYDRTFSITTRISNAAATITGNLVMTAIAVADSVVLTLPQTSFDYDPQSVNFLTPAPTVADPDTGDTITLLITPSNPSAGLISSTASGWTRVSGSNALRVAGSVATVNAVLAGLTWTASQTSAFSISNPTPTRTWVEDIPLSLGPNFLDISADGYFAQPLSLTFSATSNANEVGSQTLALNPVNYVVGNITATMSMPAAAGEIDMPSVIGTARWTTTVSAGVRTYTMTGLASDLNTMLSQAVFKPTLNHETSFSISFVVGGLGSTSVTMNATPINDLQTLFPTAADYIYSPAGTLALSGIAVADPDINQLLSLSLRPSDRNAGTISSPSASFNLVGGIWGVSGSVAEINAHVSGLRYVPALPSPEVVGGLLKAEFPPYFGVSPGATSTISGTVVANTEPVAILPYFGAFDGRPFSKNFEISTDLRDAANNLTVSGRYIVRTDPSYVEPVCEVKIVPDLIKSVDPRSIFFSGEIEDPAPEIALERNEFGSYGYDAIGWLDPVGTYADASPTIYEGPITETATLMATLAFGTKPALTSTLQYPHFGEDVPPAAEIVATGLSFWPDFYFVRATMTHTTLSATTSLSATLTITERQVRSTIRTFEGIVSTFTYTEQDISNASGGLRTVNTRVYDRLATYQAPFMWARGETAISPMVTRTVFVAFVPSNLQGFTANDSDFYRYKEIPYWFTPYMNFGAWRSEIKVIGRDDKVRRMMDFAFMRRGQQNPNITRNDQYIRDRVISKRMEVFPGRRINLRAGDFWLVGERRSLTNTSESSTSGYAVFKDNKSRRLGDFGVPSNLRRSMNDGLWNTEWQTRDTKIFQIFGRTMESYDFSKQLRFRIGSIYSVPIDLADRITVGSASEGPKVYVKRLRVFDGVGEPSLANLTFNGQSTFDAANGVLRPIMTTNLASVVAGLRVTPLVSEPFFLLFEYGKSQLGVNPPFGSSGVRQFIRLVPA